MKNKTGNERLCVIKLNRIVEMFDELTIKYTTALLIQNAWRNCISNPAYRVCRCRLYREFNELMID